MDGNACSVYFFFFNDTATTEIYTLSLHDALPIFSLRRRCAVSFASVSAFSTRRRVRSEEHTSELQSHEHLVCRLLLEKTINTKLLAKGVTASDAEVSRAVAFADR